LIKEIFDLWDYGLLIFSKKDDRRKESLFYAHNLKRTGHNS